MTLAEILKSIDLAWDGKEVLTQSEFFMFEETSLDKLGFDEQEMAAVFLRKRFDRIDGKLLDTSTNLFMFLTPKTVAYYAGAVVRCHIISLLNGESAYSNIKNLIYCLFLYIVNSDGLDTPIHNWDTKQRQALLDYFHYLSDRDPNDWWNDDLRLAISCLALSMPK